MVCEALACGTPVLATKVNGIPEILHDRRLGLMVERTPEAFSQGIQEAFSTDWDAEYIAECGRSRTWENVANDVYGKLVEISG